LKHVVSLSVFLLVVAVVAMIALNVMMMRRSSSSSSSSSLSTLETSPQQRRTAEEPKVPQYHVLFSTSCSPFQDWQSISFFHFAHRARQPGHITRLVSGCTPEKARTLQQIHDEVVAPLNPDRYHLHVTPDYGHGDGQRKYWNKPLGVLDYMENVLGYSNNNQTTDHRLHDDDIIILVDPDMMLLRPITGDFTNYRGGWSNGDPSHVQVRHGRPFAQRYAYGAAWVTSLNGHLADVVGPGSPALNLSLEEAGRSYPAGPPYVATARDMYRIATYWVQFLPKIWNHFDGFMAEMHAYSTAAAHLQLPHQLARAFMASDVPGPDFFSVIGDRLTRSNACRVAVEGVARTPDNQRITDRPVLTDDYVPYVLHFCQRYALGRWFFSKYKLHEDVFDCHAPLLKEPPMNVAELYSWSIFPNGIETFDYSTKNQDHIARNAWFLCSIIYGLNEVITKVKQMRCGGGDNNNNTGDAIVNWNKTFHFHDEDKFRAMLDDPSNPFHRNTTR
jgi:hypothetical protein